MKIPSSLLAVVVLCLAGVARAAPVVTVEGFIGRGPEPENGTFTATVEATSDDGDVLVALLGLIPGEPRLVPQGQLS